MPKLFVLIRKISPYTAADILLGAFISRRDAELSLEAYRKNYLLEPQKYPWKGQAYIKDPLSEERFSIEEFIVDTEITAPVFVVSQYVEDMGQIDRSIDKIYIQQSLAEHRCTQLEEAFRADTPFYAGYQALAINQLSSDTPENQPDPTA